jgi:hypothetical protein
MLLKNGGYTFAFRTLSAGQVAIRWYYLPNGAKIDRPSRKPKPVLIASGKTSFAKAGATRVTIKLANSGRRMLGKTNRLKLTAKGTYTPSGKSPVGAIKKFTLKR